MTIDVKAYLVSIAYRSPCAGSITYRSPIEGSIRLLISIDVKAGLSVNHIQKSRKIRLLVTIDVKAYLMSIDVKAT